MKNYRNNFKRNRFRNNNDRSFKNNNGSIQKFNADYSINPDFKRKKFSKNINVTKLIEKYTELAREALSNGDKILSENYYQHADHFQRIFESQNSAKIVEKNPNNENIEISEQKNTINS